MTFFYYGNTLLIAVSSYLFNLALVVGLSGLVEGRVLGCFCSFECFGCEDGGRFGVVFIGWLRGVMKPLLHWWWGLAIGLAHLMLWQWALMLVICVAHIDYGIVICGVTVVFGVFGVWRGLGVIVSLDWIWSPLCALAMVPLVALWSLA